MVPTSLFARPHGAMAKQSLAKQFVCKRDMIQIPNNMCFTPKKEEPSEVLIRFLINTTV
jgi:hypothetical protein